MSAGSKIAGANCSELSFRMGEKEAILEWRSTCPFHEILVERKMCEAVDYDALPGWLFILDGHKGQVTTNSKVTMENNDGQVRLTFGKAFLEPKSIALSSEEKVALRKFLRNSFARFLISGEPSGEDSQHSCVNLRNKRNADSHQGVF
ncbi:MAG: hypothetical protein K2W95_34830 [Candidatus Obscuribacterales bacterium]|nr:hypothetical protein [Candidatus Obscuribacterales bacterium]